MNRPTIDSLPVLGERSYKNPVTIRNMGGEDIFLTAPDPYVIKYNGRYYCYATGVKGVIVLQSRDLVEWEYHGHALSYEDQTEYWAPAVLYENGIFYMYYSSMPAGETDCHKERLKVAVSRAPLGPFSYIKTLFDEFSIDPHVIKDRAGDFYLFYSANREHDPGEKPGTVILVDRLLDFYTPEGNPFLAVRPTHREEMFMQNRFGDGRDWYTVEGAFYLNRKGRHYLMYSGNAYTSPEYFVGTCTAEGGERSLQALQWEKGDINIPLLKMNQAVQGTGHNCVIKAPNNIDDWIVYHGRSNGYSHSDEQETRQMRIDPLLWSGYATWTPGPSYWIQDAPAMPTFRELFNEEGIDIEDKWSIEKGLWKIRDGQLHQVRRGHTGAVISKRSFSHYIFLSNIKWGDDTPGGLYGVYACYQDAKNNVQILFNPGEKKATARYLCGGVCREKKLEIPQGFNFSVFHQVKIEKTGRIIEVYVDDLWRARQQVDWDEVHIGMIANHTKASFAGIEVTEYLGLSEKTQNEFMRLVEPSGRDWEYQDGVIYHHGPNTGRLVFRNSLPEEYCLSFDFRIAGDSPDRFFSLSSVHLDGKDGWFMRIEKNIITVDLLDVDIPISFMYDALHTIWIKRKNGKVIVLMDRDLLYEGNCNHLPVGGFVTNTDICLKNIQVTCL